MKGHDYIWVFLIFPLTLQEKQEEELLTTLPPPTPSQISAVGSAIDRVVREFGLHNENLDQRLEIKRVMESVFQHKLPGIF